MTFSPTRKPTRKIVAIASHDTGTIRRSGSRGRPRPNASSSIRTSRYSRNGYASGTEIPISAWLKNASEIENASSTSRSRCSSDGRRRQGKNGATNKMHSGIQTYHELTRRPNAPG